MNISYKVAEVAVCVVAFLILLLAGHQAIAMILGMIGQIGLAVLLSVLVIAAFFLKRFFDLKKLI